MQFTKNKASIIGNLTRDGELSYTPKGTPKLLLNLVTSISIKDGENGYKDIPQFHRVIVWGKAREDGTTNIDFFVKLAKKGVTFAIDGRIETQEYTDKNNVKQRMRQIVAEDVLVPNSFYVMNGLGVEKKQNNVQKDSQGNVIEDIVIPDEFSKDLPF